MTIPVDNFTNNTLIKITLYYRNKGIKQHSAVQPIHDNCIVFSVCYRHGKLQRLATNNATNTNNTSAADFLH